MDAIGRSSLPAVHKYLFVISPNSSGSTLVCKILNRSVNASFVNHQGTMEAQKLPEVSRMFPKGSRWDPDLAVDWNEIKRIFLSRWDMKRPILIDKSPWFLPRVKNLESVFDPAYFIFVVRNPYAVAESIMRRGKRRPRQAARIVQMKLGFQRENMGNAMIKNRILVKYEELTDNPDSFVQVASEMLPELQGIHASGSFAVHNYKKKFRMPIQNLNEEKIGRLSDGEIAEMNEVFERDISLLDYFGYRIISK